MTETVKPRPGKGYKYFKNPHGAGKKFDAEAAKAAKSKFFRNFNRTKSKAYMTSYDDVHFLAVNKFKIADILGGADPETTFDLILNLAWEQGCQTGNIKDLDGTQEAAFTEWVKNWTVIAWDIAAQKALRPFLAAIVESSTTTTTVAALAIWTQSDWDNFIISLEKLDCPDFIYRFMKPFLYIIRMTEEYERAGVQIPPSYFLLFEHVHNMADLAAHRDAAKAIAGHSMVHCKKFGIPFSKFSAEKLSCTEVSKMEMWNNQDLLAYFSRLGVSFYDNTPTVKTLGPSNMSIYTGTNKTTDFTNAVYPFIEGQPMSLIHALYPCFGSTIANNERGEIFSFVAPQTNEYEVNIRLMKLLGTTWDFGVIETGAVDDAYRYLTLFMAFNSSDATGAMYWTGTKVTANQPPNYSRSIWFQVNPKIMVGTSVSYSEQIDSVDNAFKYMIYGSGE